MAYEQHCPVCGSAYKASDYVGHELSLGRREQNEHQPNTGQMLAVAGKKFTCLVTCHHGCFSSINKYYFAKAILKNSRGSILHNILHIPTVRYHSVYNSKL